MKKIKVLSLGLIVSFVAAVGVMGTTSAMWSPNFSTSNDTVTLAKGDTHEGSLYAAGNHVTVDGTITGSLYCAGSTVVINGTVEGDVLCAGQKVTINGEVGQDVRVAGQFVEIDGSIGGSLTALAQDVRLNDGANVADDVNGVAQQFTLDGMIGRDVAIGTQLLALNGEVKGTVDAATEQIQLGDQAAVTGNLNYTASEQLSFDDSSVAGEVTFNPAPDNQHRSGSQLFSAMKLLFLLMLAASAIVAVLVMPRFMNRSSELFRRQIPLTALVGFAVVFGGPILVGLLLFSILFVPVGLALLFAWLTVVFLSCVFFIYWVGSELLRSQQNAIVRMLGGLAIILVLSLIPYVGAITMFVALVIGSGIIVMTLTNGYRRPHYNVTTPTKKPAKKSTKA